MSQALRIDIRSRKPIVRKSDLIQRVLLPTDNDNCGICQDQLGPVNVVSINDCDHQFHQQCLYGWFNKQLCCPFCKENLVKHYGNQPMPVGSCFKVDESKRRLPGYANDTSLVVTMFIPGGIQGRDGKLPGKPFAGVEDRLWFPNTPHFSDMISLLKKAWDQRLVYTYHEDGTHLVINGFIFERTWKKPIPNYAAILNMCFQEIELAT